MAQLELAATGQSQAHAGARLLLCLSIAVVGSSVFYARVSPVVTGDALEYLMTLEALAGHATPDIRPADSASLDRLLHQQRVHMVNAPPLLSSKSGRTYTLHFWFYPLLCLPMRLLLSLLHGNELMALPLTNLFCLLLTLFVALDRNTPLWPRPLLTAIASLASPVLWYIPWCHPEAFSFAGALMALVLSDRRRHALACLCAAVAAAHNPPILFLMAVPLIHSFQSARSFIWSAAACLPAFVPIAFSLHSYGVVNPLLQPGGGFALISWLRTWSYFTDLCQGLLPYVPILVLALPFAFLAIILRRDWTGAGVGGAYMAMVLTLQLTSNWNSGCAGLMRYAVWTLPPIAWIVTRAFASRPFIAVSSVFHVLVLLLLWTPPGPAKLNPVASFVLRRAPALYWPEPEIFGERLLAAEVNLRPWLPIAFVREDGAVTRILVDDATLPAVSRCFNVEATYAAKLTARTSDSRLYYLTPPPGAVRDPLGGAVPPTTRQMRQAIRLKIREVVALEHAGSYRVVIVLANSGPVTYPAQRTGMFYPLRVAWRFPGAEATRVDQPIATKSLDRPLDPGQSAEVQITVELPHNSVACEVEFAPMLVRAAWGNQPHLELRGSDAAPSDSR